MTFVDEIISAMEALGGYAHYSDLYKYIQEHTKRELSGSWQAIVRARIEERSSDSASFLNGDDLFFSVNGIGNGFWGLRSKVFVEPSAPDLSEPNLPPRANIKTSRVIRDTNITRELKLIYRNHCQVCGNTITLLGRNYSEGHHIKPLGNPHNGYDLASNIIILCPNHHVEFDYGSMAIDPDTYSILCVDASNKYLGKKIHLEHGHLLDHSHLEYHLLNIYSHP
jgi:hypothetical protein